MKKRIKTKQSSREFDVVIERDSEGWYVASVPALAGCYTQAKSLDTLMKRVEEVIMLCLEDDIEDYDSKFLGIQLVAVKI